MFSDVKNFVLEKLLRPVFDESVAPYNMYNTFFYAVFFAAGIIYLVKPALEKLGVEYSKKLFISFSPWIVLGGILSSAEIRETATVFLTYTPVLISVIVACVLVAVFVGKELEKWKSIDYTRTVFVLGLFLSVISLSAHNIENFHAVGLTALITSLWLIPGIAILKKFSPDFLSLEIVAPVAMHYLDATTTAVALRFGASEQHIVASYFIEVFGPYGVFLLKTLAVVPAVLIINKEVEGEEKMFYLFVIAALGLGIAVRNLFHLI
ncbi:DUF63 family protein [Candidatus Nanosalina sp. VS9-1]|uniref:DUF63 family protein n=1 Tax=Candidatus Nanosalina sp. VS9-1 TaxID=3388566 RepID=UPI0039DFADA2